MTAASVRRGAALALIGVFALITALGVALTAARASAVFEEIAETGRPGLLRLGVDSATPLHADLAPGDSMRWLVEASLLDAERSTLEIEVDASGDLIEAGGMTARVSACTGAFDLSAAAASTSEPVGCSGERSSVVAETPLAALARDGERFELAELRRGEPRQLLVTLELPAAADPAAIADTAASIALGVHAAGGEADPPPAPVPPVAPPGPIPVTGADLLALGALAIGLSGLGAGLALRGARRERGAA